MLSVCCAGDPVRAVGPERAGAGSGAGAGAGAAAGVYE